MADNGMRKDATTDDYRSAIFGEGPYGSLEYEWSDKPHRLVYDLCNEVDSLKAELKEAREIMERVNRERMFEHGHRLPCMKVLRAFLMEKSNG